MKDYKTILIYILLFTNILMILIFSFAQADSGQCLANPFKYGAEKLSEATESNLMCSCSYDSQEYKDFRFDRTGILPNLLEDPLPLLG